MRITLADKRALVVGRGRIAEAIASALAANGAAVSAASVTTAASDVTTSPVRLNLSSAASASAAAAAYAARFGAPWLMVNVSGEIEADMRAADLRDDGTQETWFAHAARAFAPDVRRVVNVISGAGVVAVRGAAAYSARQAGLASLTRALAMELGPDVAVNGLAVGAVSGELPVADHFVSHSPLKRAGTLDEYARAALFLADPMNTYTTGHVMCVDGGWSIGYARDF